MITAILVVIAMIATVASAVRVAFWGRHARARQRLSSGASELTDHAVVTLTGRVRAIGEPLIAPLSGRACVAYEAVAQHALPKHPAAGAMQLPDLEERRMIAFDLEVNGQIVRIEGIEAELTQSPAAVIPRRLEREQAFVVKYGRPFQEHRERTSYETVVEPGMFVSVHGVALADAQPDPSIERGYRDSPVQYRIVAQDPHPLTIGVPR